MRHAAEHPDFFIGGPSEWGQLDKSCLKAPHLYGSCYRPKGWGTRVLREADFERSPGRLGRDNIFSGWPPQAQPRLNMRTRVRCLQLTKQWFTTDIQHVTCTAIRKDMETQKNNRTLRTSSCKLPTLKLSGAQNQDLTRFGLDPTRNASVTRASKQASARVIPQSISTKSFHKVGS